MTKNLEQSIDLGKKVSTVLQGVWLLISAIVVNEYEGNVLELDTILLMIYISAPVIAYHVLSWLEVLKPRPVIFLVSGILIQIVAIIPIENSLYGRLEEKVWLPMILAFVIFYITERYISKLVRPK